MNILGINAYHPDSSACVVINGSLVAAVEEERFTRIKHWAGFPAKAINYCLNEAKLSAGDLDYIAVNRDPKANFLKKVLYTVTRRPRLMMVRDRLQNIRLINNIKHTYADLFLLDVKKLKTKIINVEHHHAHLASAFYVCDYRDAAVVTIDGFGDFTSCMVAKGSDKDLTIKYQIHYPHSLGLFYTALTQFLGFKRFGDEYKVMGLAAFGKPRYMKEMEKILILKPNGTFCLNLEYFVFQNQLHLMQWENSEPLLEDVFSQAMPALLGPTRSYEEEISSFHCDIASSLQTMYEKAFFHILNHAHALTRTPNLCLAGGCGFNSVANGKIFGNTEFTQIYIQPASGDAGGAIGAAYYLHNALLRNDRNFTLRSAYWGPCADDLECEKTLHDNHTKLLNAHCSILKMGSVAELCKTTAQKIAEGKIVGWFQGRAEWGPRALGNRSILVDPRRKEMVDILNERIKRREWFRPFAPSILAEHTGDFFEIDYPDPFMLKVYSIKPEKRSIIPAVTHIDGTGRLQTVHKETNSLYWNLISEFYALTGIPIVLNTSFNENEPIVCYPQEALDCFLRTKMDILALGNFLISKAT